MHQRAQWCSMDTHLVLAVSGPPNIKTELSCHTCQQPAAGRFSNSSAAAWCGMARSSHLPINKIDDIQLAQHALVYLCLRTHGLGASLPGWKHPTAAAVWSTTVYEPQIDGY